MAKPLVQRRAKSIQSLIGSNRNKPINDFTTDAQVLFGLLTLIVEIKYRNKYSESVDNSTDDVYSPVLQFNKVLADQISPVDSGPLGT